MIINQLVAENVLKYVRLELRNLPTPGVIAISGSISNFHAFDLYSLQRHPDHAIWNASHDRSLRAHYHPTEYADANKGLSVCLNSQPTARDPRP